MWVRWIGMGLIGDVGGNGEEFRIGLGKGGIVLFYLKIIYLDCDCIILFKEINFFNLIFTI